MNEYIKFAKDNLLQLDGSIRSDSAQALATIVIAGALIAIAEILEEGLTNKR